MRRGLLVAFVIFALGCDGRQTLVNDLAVDQVAARDTVRDLPRPDAAVDQFPTTGWTPRNSGTTENLNGVWGSGASDVWAVGSNGIILHWDGTTWTAVKSGTNNDLNGVWGSSATDVWAVGGGIILHWNGTAWSTSSVWGAGAVWGSAASDVWAAGFCDGEEKILHWDGKTWSDTAIISTDCRNLGSVWGSGSSDVWAVGGQWFGVSVASVLFHWNGTGWSEIPGPAAPLAGVWGSGPSDFWAVGDVGFGVLHWDGQVWSQTTGGSWHGVWGIGSDLWAVGESGILHWNGIVASKSTPTVQELFSVWGSSATDVWAVGTRGTILHYTP